MRKKSNFRFLLLLMAGILVSFNAMAQSVTVKGHVQDSEGMPITFANVVSLSTKALANTDANGDFAITVDKGEQVRVSYLGYKTQTLAAQDGMQVVLEDNNDLGEAVVVGYARVKKTDATGSVVAIKPDEMSKGITTNAQDMLVGKVAGLAVTTQGGTPGGSASIRIRGGSSLNASNDPLIVIDGLAIDNDGVKGLSNPLAMVNPEDIASFSVLKDASATAIYGSRASNGVIIITTKKGSKDGTPKVTFGSNISLSTPRKTYDLLNGDQYRAFARQAYVAANPGDPDALNMPALGNASTDWQDEIYRTAISHEHNVSINGGLKNMPYRISFGYTDQDGIAKTSNFERYTASVNLAPSFFDDYLQFNLNAKYMNSRSRYVEGGVFGNAIDIDPTRPVRSDEAIYQQFTDGYYQLLQPTTVYNNPAVNMTVNTNTPENPVAWLNQHDKHSNANTFIGNLEADYKLHFFPDLHIHANIGGDYSEGKEEHWISPYSRSNYYYGWDGVEKSYKYNLQGNVYAQYIHQFGVHGLDLMAGAEQQHFHRMLFSEGQGNDWYANGVKLDTPTPYNPAERVNTKRLYRSSLVSYFGRLNYNLMDKYLLTFTMRWDGSSRFSKDNRWGEFPSLALGWKLKEENFLKNVDFLSELKLRLGWGITGQQSLPEGYEFYYSPRYMSGNAYANYPFGDTYYGFIRPEAYNPDLKWEKTTTWNAGIDYGFLNGRIVGSLDWYYRKTTDLMTMNQVATGTNFLSYVMENVGSLKNYGLEFMIDARPVMTNDFTWQVTYNVTWNKNKVTKIDGTQVPVMVGESVSGGLTKKAQANIVGSPVNSFYVYQQVYDEAGKPIEGMYVDRNGNGVIDDDDRYVYKKPTPDVTMGMTNKFIYKNWDFSFTLRASLNNYLYYDFLVGKSNTTWASVYSNSAYHNTTQEAIDLGFTGKDNYALSDYFVRNASFLRCDNINLGYTFHNLFKGQNYNGVGGRIFVLVQNPFVITKYKGLDPELADGVGVDKNIYPRATTYQLGLNLQF